MKLDVTKLSDRELKEFIEDDEILLEEEAQLEKRDNKKNKKKILHKNTRKIFRR